VELLVMDFDGVLTDNRVWVDEQLAKNPEWVEDQKAGRALWWDKKQDVDTTSRNAASKVAQKSYPYDVNFFGE
jgi:3-deoxy-D-manno-octulosonate 8-phosphate phosphatase KdsC-like HAD superfamily phosphatase